MVDHSSQNGNDSQTWGIHWFRRDLKVTGNAALQANFKKSNGRVLGFFCFDSQFLSRSDFSHNRFAFFLKSLVALKKELQTLGGDLLVVDCLPELAFGKLLHYFENQKTLKIHKKPTLVTWNRDYEPFARNRDEKMKVFFQSKNIAIETFRDHLIFEPYEVLKSPDPQDFYQIYSPYARKWLTLLASDEGQNRIKAQQVASSYYKKFESNSLEKIFHFNLKGLLNDPEFPFSDSLNEFIKANETHVTVPIPDAGSLTAFKKMQSFKSKIQDYQTSRDFPAAEGTSKLSVYLKNGSLTSSQIISELHLQNMKWEPKGSENQFTKEIIWREFYYSILFHRPDVEKQCFNPNYKNIVWENNKSYFSRWQEGTTGFPIVDAGMRELLQTGWMHNRVRMIVASFLTKDLLIDWRWGENHFMKYLLDGDLAPNNGGWQWAASTGCDPQPYFRIFNPWLQSEKFDPDGEYIRRFIPELKNVATEALHDPDADRSKNNYPKPIVIHKNQKEKALALYKK